MPDRKPLTVALIVVLDILYRAISIGASKEKERYFYRTTVADMIYFEITD